MIFDANIHDIKCDVSDNKEHITLYVKKNRGIEHITIDCSIDFSSMIISERDSTKSQQYLAYERAMSIL